MIKKYLTLTKPGIIFGNVITAAAGFALASKGHFDFWLFCAMLIGLSLIIASACVFNNYMDRDIDSVMARTKNRPLVQGSISTNNAIVFGIVLGALGSTVLFMYTNLLTLFSALIGFIVYVFVYGIAKRRSVYATLIGSIAGGMPPVVGYCAVSNNFDLGTFIIFMIIVLWQMPHFYAIAMYRLTDYQAASIPVLPAQNGIQATKIEMFLYVIAFTVTTFMLTLFGYTGYMYLAVAAMVGLAWIKLSYNGFTAENDTLWAQKMFRFSLVAVMALCIMILIDPLRN